MTKYPLTKSTSKIGVNYVRGIVEANNSIFNEIHQENDVGIDAIIEFVIDEVPTGNCISVQIKSGSSYFNAMKNECLIPIEDHLNYWENYTIPVFGIVYVPQHESAYWLDIKKFIKKNKMQGIDKIPNVIKFKVSKLNKFDTQDFEKIFVPHVMREIPKLTFEEALDLFHSKNYDEKYVGLFTLFKKYADRNIVWDEFVSYFKNNETEDIPNRLIYILSHIPWHPDLWSKGTITEESRTYAKNLLNNFGEREIIKLLNFIDTQHYISRGSMGQCVEAIISSIPKSDAYLKKIVFNKDLPLIVREGAAAIFAYHKGKDSLTVLKKISEKDSWYIPLIIDFIEDFGNYDPY